VKIGITYDLRDDYIAEGYNREEAAEFDCLETIEAIEQNLHRQRHETERIGTAKRLIEKLAAGNRWDMVFNIAEGLWGFGREAQVPAILDVYRIPYTFSDPMVLSVALHKGVTKQLVRDLGLATPDFFVVENENQIAQVHLPFPLFAKPVAEGTSKGIDAASKINSREELRQVCTRLLARFAQPVLVETFLPGREFTVGLLGTGDEAWAVAAMEVVLLGKAEQEVYSYLNKQDWEDRVTYRLETSALGENAKELALAAWRGLGCRDGGRIDIRCDAYGQPNFVEVNPLAGLNPVYSDLPILCRMSGIEYDKLLALIMQSAMKRVSNGRIQN
jgi:D-alanine-D-alanine ligase